jgi:hypothetical protein
MSDGQKKVRFEKMGIDGGTIKCRTCDQLDNTFESNAREKASQMAWAHVKETGHIVDIYSRLWTVVTQ